MENKSQNKNQSNKKPENKNPYNRGGGQKSNSDKKPFNFYWIYAIVGVVLISINLLNFGGSGMEISPSQVESYVIDGDVDKIVVINGKQ
jgi:cell division protease FtsH